MQDSRVFTDYQTSCQLNDLLQKKFNVKNSNEYRYYLQQNAEQIMKDFTKASGKEECESCPVCGKALEYKPTGNTDSQL
jgi:hypothetical protein